MMFLEKKGSLGSIEMRRQVFNDIPVSHKIDI